MFTLNKGCEYILTVVTENFIIHVPQFVIECHAAGGNYDEKCPSK